MSANTHVVNQILLISDSLTDERLAEEQRSSFDAKINQQWNEERIKVRNAFHYIDKTLKYPHFHQEVLPNEPKVC